MNEKGLPNVYPRQERFSQRFGHGNEFTNEYGNDENSQLYSPARTHVSTYGANVTSPRYVATPSGHFPTKGYASNEYAPAVSTGFMNSSPIRYKSTNAAANDYNGSNLYYRDDIVAHKFDYGYLEQELHMGNEFGFGFRHADPHPKDDGNNSMFYRGARNFNRVSTPSSRSNEAPGTIYGDKGRSFNSNNVMCGTGLGNFPVAVGSGVETSRYRNPRNETLSQDRFDRVADGFLNGNFGVTPNGMNGSDPYDNGTDVYHNNGYNRNKNYNHTPNRKSAYNDFMTESDFTNRFHRISILNEDESDMIAHSGYSNRTAKNNRFVANPNYVSRTNSNTEKTIPGTDSQDADPHADSRAIYIGNLHNSTTSHDISTSLRNCGPLEKVKMMSGFCFVYFLNGIDAVQVLGDAVDPNSSETSSTLFGRDCGDDNSNLIDNRDDKIQPYKKHIQVKSRKVTLGPARSYKLHSDVVEYVRAGGSRTVYCTGIGGLVRSVFLQDFSGNGSFSECRSNDGSSNGSGNGNSSGDFSTSAIPNQPPIDIQDSQHYEELVKCRVEKEMRIYGEIECVRVYGVDSFIRQLQLDGRVSTTNLNGKFNHNGNYSSTASNPNTSSGQVTGKLFAFVEYTDIKSAIRAKSCTAFKIGNGRDRCAKIDR
jgi:hypothetical protein